MAGSSVGGRSNSSSHKSQECTQSSNSTISKTPRQLDEELPANSKLDLAHLDNRRARQWIVRELTRKPALYEEVIIRRSEGRAWEIALQWKAGGVELKHSSYPRLLDVFSERVAQDIYKRSEKTIGGRQKNTAFLYRRTPDLPENKDLDLATMGPEDTRAWLFRELNRGQKFSEMFLRDNYRGKWSKEDSTGFADKWQHDGRRLKAATTQELRNCFEDRRVSFHITHFISQTRGLPSHVPEPPLLENKNLHLASLHNRDAQRWLIRELTEGFMLGKHHVCWPELEAKPIADRWHHEGRRLIWTSTRELMGIFRDWEVVLCVHKARVRTIICPLAVTSNLDLATLSVTETKQWLLRELRLKERFWENNIRKYDENLTTLSGWSLDGPTLNSASLTELRKQFGEDSSACQWVYKLKESTANVQLPENKLLDLSTLSAADTSRWIARELGRKGNWFQKSNIKPAEKWQQDGHRRDGYSLKKATVKELNFVFGATDVALYIDQRRKLTADFYTLENKAVDLEELSHEGVRRWLIWEFQSGVRWSIEEGRAMASMLPSDGRQLLELEEEDFALMADFFESREVGHFILSRIAQTGETGRE